MLTAANWIAISAIAVPIMVLLITTMIGATWRISRSIQEVRGDIEKLRLQVCVYSEVSDDKFRRLEREMAYLRGYGTDNKSRPDSNPH